MEQVMRERRLLLKAVGAAAAGIWAPHVADAQVARSASFPTQPWLDELPVSQPLQKAASLFPLPTVEANKAAGEAGRRGPHPLFEPDRSDLYEIEVKPGMHRFHAQMPSQMIVGYGGTIPGPLIHARYGRPVLIRFRNSIPESLPGYGSSDISVHLHNMHTPSASDGYPVDWWSRAAHGSTLDQGGLFKDHLYPMREAGFSEMGDGRGRGDPREALGTLWYHDHREDFTASNVYRGMAGFFLAFDELDAGNEDDPNSLRLPSGAYDLPLMVQDKKFDASGYAVFDPFDQDGFVGDKFLVNGKIQPFFHVEPRKYRLRLLAASTSRVWDFQLRFLDRPQDFQQIASDGNLLPGPVTRSNIVMGAAERNDIVVDFANFPPGAEVFLTNRLQQTDGRKPEKEFLAVPAQVLKFIVDKPLRRVDGSRVPAQLREMPPIDLDKVVMTRHFSFAREGGAWSINGRTFSEDPRGVTPRRGTREIWNLRNDSGGWAHPVHIHFEEGRILRRNGVQPPAWERGRKDVYFLGPNENVSVYLAFRDFSGNYVMHCHNTIHEDHAMMLTFRIDPPVA